MCRILIILIILSIGLNADELKNIKINSEGYSYIFFDTIPTYTTNLNDEKTKVTLISTKHKFDEALKQTHSSGKITDIYTKIENDSLFVDIILKSKSGYNSIPQPFSNSIRVDVFSWNELNPAEDKFRTAMLGYEEELLDITIGGLKEAAKDSITDAVAYLGLIFLKQGKINSAIKFLENADKNQTTVFDIYGALWQAHEIKGNTSKSESYLNQFKKKSGLSDVTKIEIDTLIEKGDQVFEDTSILFLKSKKEFTSADSSLNKKFEKVFESPDSVVQSQQTGDFQLPWWFEYVLWIAAAIALLILFFYFRWRQKEIQKRKATKKKSKGQFRKVLTEESNSSTPSSSKIVDKYKDQSTKEDQKSDKDEEADDKIIEDTKTKEEENKAINKAIDAIKEKKKEQEKLKTKQTTKKDAKLQLAMQLADEQNKIRSKDIDKMNQGIKNADPQKLNKIAEKLGIEKGLTDTKTNFEQIKSDKSTLDKLAKKFGKD